MLRFLSLALVVVSAAAAAATGAPPATVTLTHYSDAQCPCSARIPQDVQEHFLDPAAGYEGMVVFKQFFVGDLRKNVSKCIHGEAECVGQRHFACAQNMSIPSTPTASAWITFEACSYGKCTDCPAIEGKHCPCANYTSFPDFASNDQMETCAAVAGLDWAALHACGTGAEGQALMERSSTRSNEDGITYGADGLAPMYVDGAKVKTKHLIPIVCGPTPDEVKPAVCKALAAKGATPTACAAANDATSSSSKRMIDGGCHRDSDCPTGRYCMVTLYTAKSDVSECGPLPPSGCTSYSSLSPAHAGECLDACVPQGWPRDPSKCSGDLCAFYDNGERGPGLPYDVDDLLYLASSCCDGPNTTCTNCC